MLIVAVMLASSPAITSIDRRWLDLQARIEAINPINRVKPQRTSLTPRQAMAQDAEAITTVCGAAARSPDPAGFLATVGAAFKMPSHETTALRAKCTIYLMGQNDAYRPTLRR